MDENQYAEFYEDLKDKARHLIILNETLRLAFYQGKCNVDCLQDDNDIFRVPPLHQAAFDGDIKSVKKHLKEGVDPDDKLMDGPKLLKCIVNSQHTICGFFAGSTPLFIASQRGHLKIVQLLRSKGARASNTDILGFCAFAVACASNQMNVAKYLFARGRYLETRDALKGMTPLLIACRMNHTDISTWLISKGANVHACDFSGKSTLHFAAWNYNIPLIKCFIARHVKMNSKDIDGNTPLHLMLSNNTLEPSELEEAFSEKEIILIETLLNMLSNAQRNGRGLTLDFGTSVTRGTENFVKQSREKWESLAELLKSGGDQNIRNKVGRTPLHELLHCLPEAYLDKDDAIVFEPKKNEQVLVQLLIMLKLGADPDLECDGKTTPDICSSQKNGIASRIISRYKNLSICENWDSVVVKKVISNFGSKYLQSLKYIEKDIETISEMMVEPEYPRSACSVVVDYVLHIYNYVDSIVNGQY